MFNSQFYNNVENSGSYYLNENCLEKLGLHLSHDFDQAYSTKVETVDLAEHGLSFGNSPRQLVRTKVVPLQTFKTSNGTTLVANGVTSVEIISDNYLHCDLKQNFGNSRQAERPVLFENNKYVSPTQNCFWQQDKLQNRCKSSINKEIHAVIIQDPEPKIPRPPNAFMIFANQWRKKVANKFNNESNKDISVRLGQMWKNLDKSRKEEYFSMARKADAEHKMKYPDYVYNPKEARLRKALRDSWKDKSKRSSNGQTRSAGGKSLANNWSSPPITQNRTLLPMPNLSNMTFSMAADGYSMMETPGWSTNSWYPYRHNPVPYLVPQFPEPFTGESIGNYPDRMYHQPIQQSGVRSSVIGPNRSPYSEHSEPEANKGPLSQLQELANVFSSPEPCNRNPDNDVKEISPTENNNAKFLNSTKLEVESTVLNNDSDSGYVTDHPQQKETSAESEFSENVSKTGVSDVLMTENNGESFMETFENNGGESNYINMEDVFLDCNFLPSEKNFESNPNHENGEQGKNVLPGFQQAFGSTEIGRFSRNDFFTNPPPPTETAPEKVSNDHRVESPNDNDYQPVKKTRTKTVRKPRKVKNSNNKKTDELTDVKRTQNSPDECCFERQNGCGKKGRKTLNNEKSDIYNRNDLVMNEQTTYPPPFGYPSSLPSYGNQPLPPYRDEPPPPYIPRNEPYQGANHSYGNQYIRPESIFPHPYENYQHRYGYPDYPDNGYPPYMRNNYPGYSNYEYPYFRPFGFHLDYGESWPNSSSNWSNQGWMSGQQPPYNSWTSSNMFPFMRLDY